MDTQYKNINCNIKNKYGVGDKNVELLRVWCIPGPTSVPIKGIVVST